MRHQWVFRESCGCPFGVLSDEGQTVGEAWRDFYDTGKAKRSARAIGRAVVAGVTTSKVDFETYRTEVYPLMLRSDACPHRSAS